MVSNIVVDIDGSAAAGNAVEYAVGLAQQTGAAITFLSVIDMGAFAIQSFPDAEALKQFEEFIEDYLKRTAEIYIDKAVKICRMHNIRAKKAIRSGLAVETIIEEADAAKADMIIMGYHKKNAVKATILGRATNGVIRKETISSVLIVQRKHCEPEDSVIASEKRGQRVCTGVSISMA